MTEDEKRVEAKLKELGIAYERQEHDAIMTVEEGKRIAAAVGSVCMKNLFLCGKKKFCCLYLLPADKIFSSKDLSQRLGIGHLSFGKPEKMQEYLKDLAYDCPGPSPFSADTCKIRFLCTSSSVMSALLSRRSFLTQTAALAAAGIPFTVPAAASWSAEAFARTRSVTDAVLAHPFLQELASGTIAHEKVLWYLAQNVIYLKGYGESLTRVEKRLTDAADRRLLTQWIKETAQTEVWMLELIEKLRDGHDITALTRVKPSTLFYVSWEAKATLDSSVGAAWAALLPCFTLYETVGKMIAANVAPGNPYQAWLGAYGDPAYSETVKKAVGLADRLAARETAENRARMTENYLTSCRLEWILWDAAWRLKGWPF